MRIIQPGSCKHITNIVNDRVLRGPMGIGMSGRKEERREREREGIISPPRSSEGSQIKAVKERQRNLRLKHENQSKEGNERGESGWFGFQRWRHSFIL